MRVAAHLIALTATLSRFISDASPKQCHPERGLIFARHSAKINRSRRACPERSRRDPYRASSVKGAATHSHDASGLCTALGSLIRDPPKRELVPQPEQSLAVAPPFPRFVREGGSSRMPTPLPGLNSLR